MDLLVWKCFKLISGVKFKCWVVNIERNFFINYELSYISHLNKIVYTVNDTCDIGKKIQCIRGL